MSEKDKNLLSWELIPSELGVDFNVRKRQKPSELGVDFSVRKRQAHRSVDVCLTAKRKAVLSVRKCMEMETENQHFFCA